MGARAAGGAICRLTVAGAALLVGCSGGDAAPDASNPVELHVDAARAAAGVEHAALFERLCAQTGGPELVGPGVVRSGPDSLPSASPDRPGWYAAPRRVFDNLYWVGQTQYSAWAVTSSQGIIIIDPLFDYSVQAEVVEGLAELELDPADIRYVVVSHGHLDHVGGARLLQDAYGARIVMAPEDWDLVERSGGDWPKPIRDIEAYDGYELELGEVTLTLYATPGHTPGTMSTLISLRDRDEPHLAALWGGTAFNFVGGDDDARWFRAYAESAERFDQIARTAGADVLLSNHPQYDGSAAKLAALASRRPGDPHPYVVGPESIDRFLTVAAECARAGFSDEA